MTKKRFILAHHRSPGDIVCLTALLRDIHLTYPGEFETDVDTTVRPIWDNNPYITKLWNGDRNNPVIQPGGVQRIRCDYGKGIREQNHETIHFCNYFHRDFEKQTGIKVPLHHPYGDIHLSDYEKKTPLVNGRYWVILAGGKSDYPTKVWHTDYFQEVADFLNQQGLGVVQSGSDDKGHWHPRLRGPNVIDMVGKTDFREWLQQIYHAEGVICGITGAMHLAAAMQKPCVVIGGGREAWWWEAYVNENKGFGEKASGQLAVPHRYLHTIGLLDCCAKHGCWKNKVISNGRDRSLCKRPIHTNRMPIPECMNIIKPTHVTEAIMSYYEDKSLPPVSVNENDKLTIPKLTKPNTATAPQIAPKISINPDVKLKETLKPPVTKPGGLPMYDNDKIIEHPAVGGKVTICVLFYGGEEYYDLHNRCLTSIINTTPSDKIDLRVGSNALNKKSLQLIESYVEKGNITKHYRHEENAYKYPVMREMFFDETHPITTKWVIWFDDDSICDVEPNWLNILATKIAREKDNTHVQMFGAKYTYSLNRKHKEIFKSRDWYTGKPWRQKNGNPSPNGNKTIFATGGFWAITLEAIKRADIPDLGTGLTHTGGDWQIGEQLYQAGFELKQFNGNKKFVRTSSVPRRGSTMPTIDKVNGAEIPAVPAEPREKITVPQLVKPNKIPKLTLRKV